MRKISSPVAGNLEHLLDINQVALILGLAPITVRLWVSQRKIPFFKVGKSIKFKPSEIEAWINANRVEADPEHIHKQIAIPNIIRYEKGRRHSDLVQSHKEVSDGTV